MNTQEIQQKLQETQAKLEAAGIDDNAKLDLDILLLHLQRALATSIFDPLKDLDSVTVADTSKLTGLSAGVDEAIADEKKRTALVGQIVGIAQTALKAAGLPL
jgi:methylase of polypeptide subunit release factors